AGHMWMTLLQGRHVSSDVAIVDGEPRWWRHVTGEPGREGTFDHWTVHAAHDRAIEDYCGTWIRRHLKGYTGILNAESIGGRVIEVSLRMGDHGPDVAGGGGAGGVARLSQERKWVSADARRREGYGGVLFGPPGRRYPPPPQALLAQVRRLPEISSVQITF